MKKYAKNPIKYPFDVRYKKLQKLVRKVTKALQVDLIIEGKENLIDEMPSFYAPNHLSFYDPLAFLCISDDPCTFISKKEILTYPIVPTALKAIEGIFINRDDLKQTLKAMLNMEKTFAKKDRSWVVFAEGTRRKDHMMVLKEFHHGTFRTPQRNKLPIIPIAIFGTFRILKLKPQYKKYPVFIKILKPIFPNEYENMTTEELARRVQDEIQKAISFDLRKKDYEYMKKINKKYKFNMNY